MNKSIKIIITILCTISAGFLMALGFNTLDWMCHNGSQPLTWYFVFPDKVAMPYWNAYFFGGILPLNLGGMCIGIVIGVYTLTALSVYSGGE